MAGDGPRWKLAFLALAILVTGASAPALVGSWVYDDRLMVGHPMLDGIEDVGTAFARSSDDYQARDRTGPFIAQGTTYRPLPMISFILVNATVGPRPFAHHLVSLLLHLAAVALLCRLAAASWAALAGVAVFALHPAMGEAYLWINGRSDVMAGAFLAATFVALGAVPGRLRAASLFLLLVGGALSKETFVVAAAAAIVAAPTARRWRVLAKDLVILAVAYAAVLVLRAAAGGTVASTLPSVSLGALLGRAPRLLALAVETLVVPFPRPMRFLAWEMSRPLDMPTVLAAVLPVLVLVFLLIRRNARAAILVVGAVCTLLPTALVADSFWLGFDRYLYLPAILLFAAALPWLRARRWWAWCLLPPALLAVPLYATARQYRSHRTFAAALVDARPKDPSGYLIAALDSVARGDRAEAAAVMRELPEPTRIPAVAHHAARIYLSIGDQAAAATLVEKAAAEHADSPNLRFDLFGLRGAQHRWGEAAALARELSVDPARRRAVAEVIDGWLASGAVPVEARSLLEAARSP